MSTKIDSSTSFATANLASTSRSSGARNGTATTSVTAARSQDTVQLTGDAMQLQDVEKSLAKVPAVDVKRVDEIRRSIAEGRYQVNPERIASGLMQSERSLAF